MQHTESSEKSWIEDIRQYSAYEFGGHYQKRISTDIVYMSDVIVKNNW